MLVTIWTTLGGSD